MPDTIRYAIEVDSTMTIRGYPTHPVAAPPDEEDRPVTAYHERLEAGEYLDNGDEPDEPGQATLAELRAEAEARGLPSYGKKSQIAERIAKHEAAQAAPSEQDAAPAEDTDEA